MQLRLALLGCGNVGRALIAMIAAKDATLRQDYELALTFSGGLTRAAGGWSAIEGISPAALAASGWPRGALPPGARPFAGDGVAFATHCPADVLVEMTTLNPMDGQPALNHVRAALGAGRHVVTANKGPIAHAYHELRALATRHGALLRFESTVMDGTPIFAMATAALPATVVLGARGVLNSTSNYILWLMARGNALAEGIAAAQAAGVAEANPSNDLEGWDAAVKATVLANVLMGADLRPSDIAREGLGGEAMRRLVAGLPAGHAPKQIVDIWRTESGPVRAAVRLEALPPDDLLGHLRGMETAVRLRTDTMGELTIIEGEGDPGQTAFGLLADIIAVARQHHDAQRDT